MSGRMTLGSLFVMAALIPGICRAQGGYGMGAGAPGMEPGSAMSPYPGGPGGYPGGYPGGAPGMYPPGAYPQGPYGGYPPGSPNTVYEQLPDDLGFMHEDTPLETLLKNVFRHSYFRSEYLLWNGSAPGNVLLGATAGSYIPSTVGNLLPPNTFNVPTGNPLTGNVATATQPSLNEFDVKNLNGYRGTMGLPIGPGAFEVSGFVFGTRTNQFDGTSLITQEVTADLTAVPPILTTVPANFIGQPINVGGVQQIMLYTDTYQASMQSSLWGTEANYIIDAPNAGTGDLVTFSPLIGFRYLNYRESLSQSGAFQIVTDPATIPVTTTSLPRQLYSQSNNNSYGPQLGVRVEVAPSKKIVFGAEPKIMLGVNSYTAALSTINVPAANFPTNTVFSFHEKATVFSPIADLQAYTRINVSKYAHVYVAYNLMWIGSITRPYDTIGYDITADGNGLFEPKFTDTIMTGLAVGGELRF